MKITRHQDGTVSVRLPRSSLGFKDRGIGLNDLVLSVRNQANGFESMAFKYPADAADYRRLAAIFETAADELEQAYERW